MDDCISDINECSNPSSCAPSDVAICVNMRPGFSCFCPGGYTLDTDEITCIGNFSHDRL